MMDHSRRENEVTLAKMAWEIIENWNGNVSEKEMVFLRVFAQHNNIPTQRVSQIFTEVLKKWKKDKEAGISSKEPPTPKKPIKTSRLPSMVPFALLLGAIAIEFPLILYLFGFFPAFFLALSLFLVYGVVEEFRVSGSG